MPQVDPATHTIKSHGATLARTHIRDWLILLLLIVIEVVLFIIHPFYRFVGRDMMEDLKYPMKDNTVPIWAVPVSYLHNIARIKGSMDCLHVTGSFRLFLDSLCQHNIELFI